MKQQRGSETRRGADGACAKTACGDTSGRQNADVRGALA